MGLRHAAQAPAALVALLCACGSAQQGNQRRRRGRVPQRMGLGPGRGGLPGREAPSYQRMSPPRGGSGDMRWHPGCGHVETASHRTPDDL